MRSFVQLFRTPTKGISIDPNATEGAVVGENLFIRNKTTGDLELFEPSSGTITNASGASTNVLITAGTQTPATSVAGSNSGYAPDQNPAAAPTNFDLDASMIAGLNNPEFPTLNYILVGNGVKWVAVPAVDDISLALGSGPAAHVTVNRITFPIHQVAHGFVVGNVINDGTSAWAKAINSTSTLTADGIVCTVVDADNFIVQQFGTLTLTTGQWDAVAGTTGGLTRGNYYWVDSTAGKMTATQPSGSSNFQQVCIKAESATLAEILLPSDAMLGTPLLIPFPNVVQGRLTTESGVPVSQSSRLAQTTLYFTPYKGNQITLWDGTEWLTIVFSEVTLPLGTLTAALCYDVFGYLSSGVLALEMLAWTSSSARATAVTLQDGVYCKSGDKTRLYLGTFYTSSTTTTEDSTGAATSSVGGQRYLWNYYNRIARHAAVIDTTNNWSYTTNTCRQARATAGNKIEFVIGIPEDQLHAYLVASANISGNVNAVRTGIGLDTTTVITPLSGNCFNSGASTINGCMVSQYMSDNTMTAGYHYLSWNEVGGGAGTCLFLGDNGHDGTQSGLQAMILG